MKFRKNAVALILALSLMLSGSVALAASIEDTVGLPGEMSINKLVALGVMNGQDAFRPEDPFTRRDLAHALSQVLTLEAKSVKMNDLTTANGANAWVANVVGNGYIKLDAGGNFNPNKGVTYAELSRALALGLGVKAHWTDRPIDFLYYLERRGVLDIDTDLDAVVTREEAAVAIDRFVTLVEVFDTDLGVVAELGEDTITINNGAENVTYKLADNAALFMSEQSDELSTFGVGTAVEVIFNKNGDIAYMSASSLSLEEGEIVYTEGAVSVEGVLRNIDLNAVMTSLPNDPEGNFTLSIFGGYSAAGVTFGGGAYINNANDEVTMLELYMAKAEKRPFTVEGDTITLDFSGEALSNQTFSLADEVAITKASDPDKAITLAELIALQSDGWLLGTIEMFEDGTVTKIVVLDQE